MIDHTYRINRKGLLEILEASSEDPYHVTELSEPDEHGDVKVVFYDRMNNQFYLTSYRVDRDGKPDIYDAWIQIFKVRRAYKTISYWELDQ